MEMHRGKLLSLSRKLIVESEVAHTLFSLFSFILGARTNAKGQCNILYIRYRNYTSFEFSSYFFFLLFFSDSYISNFWDTWFIKKMEISLD